ncbi:sterol desaturase family protein [Pedobacter gandavensis]|uniref:Sterol desaturase family protein n=1 Tax=Pedobacter gandavensis TaxID=2679963 RepID=A0ABR6ESK9_9SPHI|nr:sterol desaturase family protein [Pedobacter gandavensis]MBB2148253.1 sterol desaturase family protein [Pedobacter gandavensis]
MQALLHSLWNNHSTLLQIFLFLGVIILIWVAELHNALVDAKEKWRHSRVNLLFITTALPIQLSLSALVILVSGWVTIHHWGLLYLLPGTTYGWLKYLIAFLLLDFCEYVYHVLMHKTPKFWNFHLIHHSDEEVDVSTTLREHPCETFIRVCFLMVWVFLSGASIGVLLLRQTIQTVANLTAHSNYKIPVKIERICQLLFITPRLHQVHHHFELPYTDCNYGDVFCIWDRLFGTYREMPEEDIKFGVDNYQNYSSSDFKALIQHPFLEKKNK